MGHTKADTYVITVQHFGQYELEIWSKLSIAFALWTEIDNFCPLCDSHPSSGHVLDCALVQENLHGVCVNDLKELKELDDGEEEE